MAYASSTTTPTCAQFLSELARDAVERGITAEVAHYSERECTKRFAALVHRPASSGLKLRLAAYFEAVVRGQVKRSRGAALAPARRKLVLMTLAEDLASVGASRDRMLSELQGVYGHVVGPEDVARVVDAARCRLAS